ncbi:MAG: cell wall hydrolase [Lachnospiraceae bacterium]|nr:cell wall hydrolase [Lachnospiraceae bacterium]
MSNRTRLKLKDLSMYMKREVFNSRYIVRNILVATVLITVLTVVYGLGSLVRTNDKNGEVEAVAEETSIEGAEETASINIDAPSTINAESINVLMANVDAGSEAGVEAVDAQMIAEASKEFDEKCVSISDNVNIREDSNTDSVIVGKMNDGVVADIIASDGEWLNISSGDVTGYVKSEYVKTGSEAYTYAQDFYSVTGSVTEDGVNIRSGASIDAEVIAAAFTGVTYEVDKEETEGLDGWVCISVDSDNKGYVSEDYIEVTEGYPVAVSYTDTEVSSNDEDKQSESKTKDNKSEDDSKNAVNNSSKTETQTTQEDKKEITTTEATTEAVTEAATESTTEAPAVEDTSTQTTVAVTARGSIALSEDDINLMAAVMTLECGNESYEGQLAVANVILNRLQSGSWGSTISGVVYAPNQFTVVNLPNFNSYISPSCLQAARDACAGTNNIGGYMSFRPVSNVDTSTLGSYTIIGNHCFF